MPPASIPAVSLGASEPVAASPAPPPVPAIPVVSAADGTGAVKPANDVEKRSIRGGANDGAGGAKSPAGENAGGTSGTTLGSVGQVIAALAIVVGLIFIGRALVAKFVPGAGASNGKGVIEILARYPLAKNQSIVLVRIGSQIVALHQGREASESILVISEPVEVARIIGQIEGKSPASMQAGFNRLLANARVDLESGAGEPGTRILGRGESGRAA